MQPTGVDSLDAEILRKILRLLTFQSRCQCVLVCKRWQQTLLSPHLHAVDTDNALMMTSAATSAGTRGRNSYVELLEKLNKCSMSRYIHTLSVYWAHTRANKRLIEVAQNLRSITIECYPDACYTQSDFVPKSLDFSNHSMLQCLTITESPIALLLDCAKLPANLKSFTFACNDMPKLEEAVRLIAKNHVPLRSLSLCTNAMWEMVPHIQSLSQLTNLTRLALSSNNDKNFEVRPSQ